MTRPFTCRLKDANGRVCRRPQKHRMHAAHGADCNIATELHHEFVHPRKAYGKFEGDPFVRLTFLVRCSDRNYLRETYGHGGMALRLREMITEDRGIGGARVRHHVGRVVIDSGNEEEAV